jgi:hypothetical protein
MVLLDKRVLRVLRV